MKELKALQMEKAEIETEIKQLENRQKILLNRKHKGECRKRTHRLIKQGAILESVFSEVAVMTGEQASAIFPL